MTRIFVARGVAVALSIGCAVPTAAAEESAVEGSIELPTIQVEGEAISLPRTADFDEQTGISLPVGLDSGDILRSIPGVTAGRMGGHGLEPVIRGQQQNQLSVIDGGAFVFGACPNRMDPPTSMAAIERADRIIVERGYHTVTNGPGGSGGTVRLERLAPAFSADQRWTLDIDTGFAGNANTLSGSVDGAVDFGSGIYIRGTSRYTDAGNYEDGDGDEVRSAYENHGAGVELGRVGDGYEFAISYDYDLTEDALFPGAGMDSPEDEARVFRLRGSHDLDYGILQGIEASAYLSQVDHVMDNFTLRPTGMMAMRVPSISDTYGGRVAVQLEAGGIDARIGADLQNNNRDAPLYAGPAALVSASDPSRERFLMWPDITIRQIGLFSEMDVSVAAETALRAGVRLDFVNASAGRANQAPALAGGQTPNDIYRSFYGTDFTGDHHETNLGGLLRLDHQLTSSLSAFAGIARVMRTADATERGMARTNWVGNPGIDPEAHHQVDIGLTYEGTDFRVGAAAYVDRVSNYILRDAFSVPGVTTYRNVDATLAGLELDGSAVFGNFQLDGDMAFTWGENRSDDMALAQIPPLSGSVTASYGEGEGHGSWRIGSRMNWAFKQGRIDPSRDAQETPGYATFDLFASYEVADGIVLSAGAANIFDVTYANHLNRSSVSDPTEVQVNEPGRTLFIRLSARF